MKPLSLFSLLVVVTAACEPVPVTLRLERPTVAELDPILADTASQVRITIEDHANEREPVQQTFDLDLPVQLEIESIPWGDDVEVRAEVLSSLSGTMLGFGRTRGAVDEGDEVVVPLRKLLAYVADRNAELNGHPLRALDVGPRTDSQPDYLPRVWESADIGAGAGVYVTADGTLLVAAGEHPDDDNRGRVVVYATTDHELLHSFDTDEPLGGLTPTSDGSIGVATPDEGSSIYIIDPVVGELEERVVYDDSDGRTSFAMGGVDAHPAQRVVYVAGQENGQGRRQLLLRIDLDGGVTRRDGIDSQWFEDVRVSPNGEELFVIDYPGGDGARSNLEVRDAQTLQLIESVRLQRDPAKPFQLFRNPDGRHLHVQRDVIYGCGGCGGGTEVFDMESHEWVFETSDVSIASATGLPDGRMIGGLSHFSNDDGGQLVWIDGPTEIGAKIGIDDYVGHVFAMAATFAERL
jgi:hypothetical protein